MFRKKGKQDAIHQANIKRGITSHFARTLKVLQQRHLQTDAEEFIYSDDYSNNLCSAMEAVFLHGLKDSVTQKVSSYVGLATPQDQSPYMNFWSICAKFTHKDVVTQLRGLSQINTEIGLCRAWIRLALNDGLMESYLHSMLVDKKTLAYYYHTHSYIRDHEQPGILKNYLTGLMSLCFKLSFNSSVLNSWNNTSLQLAGLLEGSHVPGAMLNAARQNASNSGNTEISTDKTGKSDPDIRVRSGSKGHDESIVVSKRALKSPAQSNLSGSYSSSANEPQSMFSSIRDVEEIRRFAAGVSRIPNSPRSISPSEGSTSSLISCPDPSSFQRVSGGGREDWFHREPQQEEASIAASPSLYPRTDFGRGRGSTFERKEPGFGNHEVMSGVSDISCDLQMSGESDLQRSYETDFECSQRSTMTVVAAAGSQDDHASMMPQSRPRSRRVTENEELNLSPRSLALSPSSPPSVLIHGGLGFDHRKAVAGVSSTSHSPVEDSIYQSWSHKDASESDKSGYSSPERKMAHSSDKQTSDKYNDQSGYSSPERKTGLSSGGVLQGTLNASPTPPKLSDSPDCAAGNSSAIPQPQGHARGRTYEEICATLPPLKLDPALQEAILKKVLGEIDEKADRERAERNRTDLQRASPSLYSSISGSVPKNSGIDAKSPNESTKPSHSSPPSSLNLKQSDFNVDSERGRVKNNLTSSEHEKHPADDSQSDAPNVGQSRDEQPLKGKETDSIEEEPSQEFVRRDRANAIDEELSSSSDTSNFQRSNSYGNSLNSMLGWSSEIESSQKEGPVKSSRAKARAESFASMFKSYAGQYIGIGTTLDQVLDGLPSEEGEEDGADQLSNQQSNEVAEERDSDLDDFEVLSPLPSTAKGLQNVDTSRMIHLFHVPREHGLSHQNFTCRGCARPIGIIYGKPRLCEFDGGLYCFECHQNNETPIPSAIVYNWDFSKKKVCMENYAFIQELEHQPLYDIEELNPKLESHVAELKTLKSLRKQLRYLKSYLFSCSQKMAESLRQKVWPREHLYDNFSTYSVSDLFQVQSGALPRFIKDLVKFSSKHVYECSLCCQKGFICEICRNPRVIYPFEVEMTVRCEKCKSVFHQTCMTESLPCPKCERWGKRVNPTRMPDEVDGLPDHPEDYGTSPLGL